MQRSTSEYNIFKTSAYTDDDSGISADYDYSPSVSDLNSSIMARDDYQRSRLSPTPLVRFMYNGNVQRIRPITMRNSENGDYIVCNTNRGTYVAYRTPIVPAWVTRLVHEIESRGG